MADLAAALDALERPAHQSRCGVGAYLVRLAERDPALHARVLALIDDPDVPATGLAAALASDGLDTSSSVVLRHRKRSAAGGCKCAR